MNSTEDSAKVMQTKRVLANQLMVLLESKSFKKITVNDICEGALVSRSTFYLHFEDKYHLLRYCLEQELEQWATASHDETTEDFMLFALDSILKKKKFFYNSLVSETDNELTGIFQSIFHRFFIAQFEQKQKAGYKLPGPPSIVCAFYAGGIVCSTIQWIQTDFNIPKEEIAACYKALLSDFLD